MIYSIKNEQLSVKIDEHGAELVSVCFRGKEQLWQNPTGDWAGHSPVLFPVCGNCTIVIDGITYPLVKHGFACGCDFETIEKGDTFVKMRLRSNEKTLLLYPYEFELSYTYSVNGNALEIVHELHNLSDKTMYFSMGGHESFNLDEDIDSYELRFSEEERFIHCPHDLEGMLTGESVLLGAGKVLALPTDILQNSVTVILTGVRSNRVDLHKKTGEKLAEVYFDGFDNLLLWRPMNAKMICIEPWKTLPDTVGKQYVEFSQKKGVEAVEGKQTFTTKRKICYY